MNLAEEEDNMTSVSTFLEVKSQVFPINKIHLAMMNCKNTEVFPRHHTYALVPLCVGI